ncbi:fibronectin type III domain-containing protein [Marinobacter algicola]|nr:fibronectin type III domain-containing protein [Marinobacter algicola]
MPVKSLSQNAASHQQLWKMVVAGMALAIVAGCQEDSGASRAASSQANEASEQRLGDAVSSIRDTLGQPEPVQEETSNAGTPVNEESVTPPTLHWDAPLTREDGSRLYASDISGYRIYYRLRHRDRYEVISLPSDGDTRYQLEDFPPGAYEFSITALDDSGLESRRSDAVTVNLI